ncbi:MAG TPA: energy transducer TonB [Rhabdaerophilum sp.]|nr:energy transducer TonB [Rhabdaerophilum sp.]
MSRSAFLPAASLTAATLPWAKSLALVAGLHAGIAGFAAAHLMLPTASDAISGAEMVIEFAPLVTSAESEFSPEAQNREAEDKPATPHVDENLSQKRETDLPTEQASPTTPVENDLRMAQERTRNESEKTTEMQTTEAMVEQKQDTPSQASKAADSAPEQNGKPEDETAVAPTEGNAEEAKRRIEEWQRKIFAQVVRHKRYPEAARAKRLTGETLLAFRIDRQGQVSDLRVLRSSGSAVLDKAAVAVIERANPLPPPPAQLSDRALELSLPMRFAAK